MPWSTPASCTIGPLAGIAAGQLTKVISGVLGANERDQSILSSSVSIAVQQVTSYAINISMGDIGGIGITAAQGATATAVTGTNAVQAAALAGGTGTFTAVLGGSAASRTT